MSFYGTPIGLGKVPLSPIKAQRDPSSLDVGYDIGQSWVNELNNTFWALTSYSSGAANWEDLSASTSGLVATLTGDTGGARSPTAGNINIVGTTNQMQVTGSGSTLTVGFTNDVLFPNDVTVSGAFGAGTRVS